MPASTPDFTLPPFLPIRCCCDAADVNAWALTRSYLEGLDKLLADQERSQFAYFDFKHFCKLKKTATKDHMVRVRAQLYQTQEGAVWVQLMLAPTRH